MNTDFEIVKTVHTRKGFDLWVVKIKQRVPKPVFMDLLQKARNLRGWYNSYTIDGSIPGFQFKTEAAVTQFVGTQTATATSEANVPLPRGTRPKGGGGNPNLAAKWQTLADRYQTDADKKFKELETTQSNTPKRMRQYNSKLVDANILTDMAAFARGLARHHKNGTIAKPLQVLQPVRNKGHLRAFVAGHESNGYYDAHRADKPNFLYRKEAPNIEGIKTFEQAIEVYNLLLKIDETTDNERAEREQAIKIKQLEDQVRFANIDGFFPTPRKLVEKMVNALNIQPGDTIIEPSAGMGTMAEVVREKYPDHEIGTMEINHTLAELIRAKGFNCVNDDFLKFPLQADRIIMNPPFEKWMDIDHVQHAYNCLKPGGRLISIMGAGAFYGSTNKHKQFMQWIDDVGAEYYKLPEDAFKSAFRSTGVQTYQVIIDKN